MAGAAGVVAAPAQAVRIQQQSMMISTLFNPLFIRLLTLYWCCVFGDMMDNIRTFVLILESEVRMVVTEDGFVLVPVEENVYIISISLFGSILDDLGFTFGIEHDPANLKKLISLLRCKTR